MSENNSSRDRGKDTKRPAAKNSRRKSSVQPESKPAKRARKSSSDSSGRRKNAGRSSGELARQRNLGIEGKTLPEYSKVSSVPRSVKRGTEKKQSTSPRPRRRRIDDVIPQLPVNKRISPERIREKQIMDSIKSSIDRDETPEERALPPLAGFHRIDDTQVYKRVSYSSERKSAPKNEQAGSTKYFDAAELAEFAKKSVKKKAVPKQAEPAEEENEVEFYDEEALNDDDLIDAETAIAEISRRTAAANVAVCAVMLFGIGAVLIAVPRKSGFIQSENRMLAEKPELTVQSVSDGSYFTELSEWYTDTIPVREKLKPFSSGFSKLFGVTLDDVKITGDLAPASKETLSPVDVPEETVTLNTDFTKKTTKASEAAETDEKKTSESEKSEKTTTVKKTTTTKKKKKKAAENNADAEWVGSVVVSGKGKDVRAMSAFYGMFDVGEKYAKVLNKYKKDLDSKINVYTMNMPSSSAYYMPSKLAEEFTSQKDCITNIGRNLKGVMNIDVYDALEEHSDEYIYSRTDHHWQPLGAYYAAEVFSQKAQFDFPDLKTYKEYKIKNFVGTMYAYSNYDEELNKNPDTFIYHKPDNNDELTVTYYDSYFSDPQYGGTLFFDYAEGVSCYSAILGNDDEIAEIETDVDNGRTLVIIKDSYGNALVPYLTHGFERIYVCDFRYFDINMPEFIKRVGATDVLFAVSLQAAHTEGNITMINGLRSQSKNAMPEPENYVPEFTEAETEAAEETYAETEAAEGTQPADAVYDGGYDEQYYDHES